MDVKIKGLGKFKLIKSKLGLFTGLRFSRRLNNKTGIILADNKESAMVADMLFVFFSIDMAFLDKNKKIIDLKRNVKPFTLFVKPKKKSMYLVEMNSGEMKKLKIGDKLSF